MQNGKASLDVQAELVKLAINSDFFVDEETKFFVALWERKKVLLHFHLVKSRQCSNKREVEGMLVNIEASHCRAF